ncbi:DegT/DnrJ/EryC1/StrS aminotransferase family protein, partial [Candidatus Roizmanbacteria bacterium]|nr:DegT/DnrJ/EryC1/StrS aminotransferase family protein [Candidatus Roizmanbacteria bacterium]
MNKGIPTLIPVSRPLISKIDINAVAQAVKSTFVANGPSILEFEKQMAIYCGRKYAVAVSNGTQALYLAVKSLNLPQNSKIFVPSFTIVSALFAIIESGHIPYFSDVMEDTWNINEKAVQKGIEDGIAAAIIVETYASAPPMKDIAILLQKYNIPMIEDAAEGFGGADEGKKFGSFGDLSAVSFYSNKLITMGEGGMILTDNQSLYQRLCMLRNLFFNKERTFIHDQLSGNTRITNYQAALGLSQLKRINSFYKQRQRLYTIYSKMLNPLQDKIQFQFIQKDIKSSYWVFPILLKKKS